MAEETKDISQVAAKGGKARASVLTADERRDIARGGALARWRKEKGEDYKAPAVEEQDEVSLENFDESEEEIVDEPSRPTLASLDRSNLPYSMFSGKLELGDVVLDCHVLNDLRRVLTQRKMISGLGMSHGSAGKQGGDRLGKFLAGKAISPFVSNDLQVRIDSPMRFVTDDRQTAFGYEATVLVDICEAVLKARDADELQKQQEGIAKRCEILLRAFAKVGIIALIDEVTGYQEVRAKQALQLKVQAFIAEDLQEWAKMFPDEFWYELARLEGIRYSARSRPLRWGKYVMAFVYDAVDADIGQELRRLNPQPHFLKNHHQWLKSFGREKVNNQIQRVIAVMALCDDMDDFRKKFKKVFQKTSGLQFSFEDIAWGTKPLTVKEPPQGA